MGITLTAFQKSVMPTALNYGDCYTDRPGKDVKNISKDAKNKNTRPDFF
jgi:hypothetical protein